MAPKKAQEGPEEDLNPYGAFVNVSVARGALQLLPPTEAPPTKGKASKTTDVDATPGPPKLHLTLHLPGSYAPVVGQPTEHAGDGTYSFVFTGRSRREPSMDAMHELINGPAKLSLIESASNTCLATALVDMLDFGIGVSSITVDTLQLQPEASVPASCTKVSSGVLHAVRLWLTHRPAPAPPTEPAPTTTSTRPTTPSSATKAGKPTDTAAQSLPPESQLPTPEPFSFLKPTQSETANLVELSVAAIRNLPPSLSAAVATATDGKAGGKVTFSVGLRLPEGPLVTISSGVLVSGSETQVVFHPGSRRCYITAQQVQAVQDALEDGKPLVVEVARYLAHDTMADPAWLAYVAQAVVPGTENLLQPGATSTVKGDMGTQVTLLQLCDLPGGAPQALPVYTPPQGKVTKTMEEAPAAGTCMWAQAGSQLVGLSMQFRKPVVAPWQPPPQPPVQLAALVPMHTELKPFEPPHAARDAFHLATEAMVTALSGVLKQASKSQGSSSQGSSHQAAGHQTAAEDSTSLIAKLEADGRLQQLKSALKQHAIAVALETYHLDLEGRPLDDAKMHKCLDDLNSRLAAAVDAAVQGTNQASEGQHLPHDESAAQNVQSQLQQLMSKAMECEAGSAFARAADLHQQRVLLVHATPTLEEQITNSSVSSTEAAGVWYDYATFCLRRGQLQQGRAEQALKRALQVEPSHAPSLAALCTLLLHQGRATDSLYLQEATQLAHLLLAHSQEQHSHSLHGGTSLALGLLLLICQAAGDKALAQDTATALSGLQQAENEMLQQGSYAAAEQLEETVTAPAPAEECWLLNHGADPVQANGLLAVAALAAQLHLPAVALEAIQQAQSELSRSSTVPAVQCGLALAGARAWTQVHAEAAQARVAMQHGAQDSQQMTAEPCQAQEEEALRQGIAQCNAARAAGAASGQVVDIIEGQLQHQAVHWSGCIEALARVLQAVQPQQFKQDASAPLQVYLQLAHSYQRLGWLDQACNVYMQACVTHPCATSWLGLARCHQAMCVDEGVRDAAAVQAALMQAAACDPDNPDVWAELGKEALSMGQQEEAAIHILNALQLGCEDAPLLMELANKCHALGMLSEARSCMERVLKLPSSVPRPRTQLALAEVCVDLGDAAAARMHMEAAMSAAQSADDMTLQEEVQALVPRMLDVQIVSSECAPARPAW